MAERIRVVILDDHPMVLEGYIARLSQAADIQVTAALLVGEDVEPTLQAQPTDVLLLDVQVPTSASNDEPYPIQYLIPTLLGKYPDLAVAVISMHSNRTLVRKLIDAGASGYILKNDQSAFNDLPAVIRLLHAGGGYFSPQVARLMKTALEKHESLLTPRQLEVLSYYAAYPQLTSAEVAQHLKIAHSTLRNLLSNAYLRLEAQSRAAAIAKARQLGLLSPDVAPPPPLGLEP